MSVCTSIYLPHNLSHIHALQETGVSLFLLLHSPLPSILFLPLLHSLYELNLHTHICAHTLQAPEVPMEEQPAEAPLAEEVPPAPPAEEASTEAFVCPSIC